MDELSSIGTLKKLPKRQPVKVTKDEIRLDNDNFTMNHDLKSEQKAYFIAKKTIKKTNVELAKSNHEEIVNEVPKWYKMTMDEAAGLLLKHVCYFNVERII